MILDASDVAIYSRQINIYLLLYDDEIYTVEIKGFGLVDSKKYDIDSVLKYLIIFILISILVFAFLIVRSIFEPRQTFQTELERQMYQIQQALKKNPKDALGHNDLGVVYQNAGQYDNALTQYRIALKLNPKLDKPHYNIAMIYKKQGMPKKAKTEFEAAIKIQPKYAVAYYQLGLLAYNNSKYKEALAYFQKAEKNDSMMTDYQYWLGKTYERLGQKKKAIAEYKSILKYIPDDENALKALNRLGGK